MYEVYHDTPAIPSDDDQADMYAYAAETLERYGYKRYEISNFAQRGFASMHNMRYWKQEDYMGFGPGAHSYVGGLRYSFIRDLQGYMDGVMKGGIIVDEYEKIEGLEIANEYLMLRLRMAGGRLTKERLAYLADSVEAYHIDRMKLTTCQTVQFHNLSAEATIDLMDVNMIDSFHLEAYGETAVNYNRDLEVFPVVKRIIEKITGE